MQLFRLIPLLVLLLAGCGGEPDDPAARLRATIGDAEQAVEVRSLKQAAAYISPDYRDERGNDRRAVTRLLFGYLHRHHNIHLLTRIGDLQLADDGKHAAVQMHVAMAGVPIESLEALLSIRADLYRFDLRFVDTDEGWLLISARWQPARLDDLLD
jgi:hypothetical protein